jgi:hypothetical protein
MQLSKRMARDTLKAHINFIFLPQYFIAYISIIFIATFMLLKQEFVVELEGEET